MKGRIVEIADRSIFTDNEDRVTIQFEDIDMGWSKLRLRRAQLFEIPIVLGQEVEVVIKESKS